MHQSIFALRRTPNLPSPSGLKFFCLGAVSLARHVAQWLCDCRPQDFGSLPQGKIVFSVTHADFSDSL
jgi:hypothetical protein